MRAVLVLVACAAISFAADTTAACAGCHKAESAAHPATGMAKALEPAERGGVLSSHEKLTFAQGAYQYTITRKGSESIYSVTNGQEEFQVPLSWAFGQGAAGQTYVFRRNGKWYESRVSYYKDINSLDLTVGARPEMPRSLDEAVGRELSSKGASECFHCHSTGALVNGELKTESLTPGIFCDRCHDKTVEHMAGFSKKGSPQVMPASLKNAAAEDMSEFCGQCHRTWATIATNGPHNISNVRFQPYRLANSKCYDTTDPRLRCTVCHDPHKEPERSASFYDGRCQACHAAANGKAGAKLCRIGRQNCTGCHMPKVELKEAHNRFTDHWIRIARAGEKPPF
jgi:hypothetical protein